MKRLAILLVLCSCAGSPDTRLSIPVDDTERIATAAVTAVRASDTNADGKVSGAELALVGLRMASAFMPPPEQPQPPAPPEVYIPRGVEHTPCIRCHNYPPSGEWPANHPPVKAPWWVEWGLGGFRK